MKRGTKDLYFDWDFIYEAGGLQTTALTDQRGAKAKARKKMVRLQESKIIENWDEELTGVRIIPKKQKRKLKSEVKNDLGQRVTLLSLKNKPLRY